MHSEEDPGDRSVSNSCQRCPATERSLRTYFQIIPPSGENSGSGHDGKCICSVTALKLAYEQCFVGTNQIFSHRI